MASIGTTLPVSQSSSSAGTTNSASALSNATGTDSLANESTFLTLLVTQLKNQNPENPMDGTTFVTQLAQFSDLEQNVAMRQDLDSLTTKYAPAAATTAQGSATGSSGSSDAGSGSSGNNGTNNVSNS